MSRPENRLARYRSYSYYHVLAVCDHSLTANALTEQTDLGVWQHTSDRGDGLSIYGVKEIPTSGAVNGIGKYCILINGSTNANFVITNVKWISSTAGSATMLDSGTSIAIEGSMQVSEPRGILFMDQIITCCLALGVDVAQSSFVLKTFMVGYTDDEASPVDYVNDISPLHFVITDLKGSFTERGGEYDIEFTSIANGSARIPQYSRVADGFSVNLSDNPTLAGAIDKLNAKINDSYAKYSRCVRDTLSSSTTDQTVVSQLQNQYRDIVYLFKLDDYYSSTPKRSLYRVTNAPAQVKSTADCDSGIILKASPGMSIEDVLHMIMRACPQVAEEATKGTSDGIRMEYKIQSSMWSEPDRTTGGLTFYVQYVITPFMSPKGNSVQNVLRLSPEGGPVDRSKLIQNLIEFDYLYTGRNIDILEFDMKVNMGIAYLQTATISNSLKDQLELTAARRTQVASTINQATRFGQPVQVPIFFGMQISSNLNNTQTPGQTVDAAFTMAKHSSLELQDVTMRVVGNYRLLSSVNRTSSPFSATNPIRPETTASLDDPNREADFTHWGNFPAFVKVNIKMPRNDDDLALLEQGQQQDYTANFWYQGYYYVTTIEHMFDQGEFSQVLHMIAMPETNDVLDATKKQNEAVDNFRTQVKSCYDVVPANTTGSTSPATQAPRPAVQPFANTTAEDEAEREKQKIELMKSVPPVIRQDAETMINSDLTLEDVIGWNEASQEVKDAIIAAANRHGVNVVTMAMFARHESKFNPIIQPPFRKGTTQRLSSAVGLYQFINKTWLDLTKQGNTGVNISGLSDAQILDLRYNARDNALGGARLLYESGKGIRSTQVGDLYLAHFAGYQTAYLVVAFDRAGKGDTLMEDALPPGRWDKIRAANPSLDRINSARGQFAVKTVSQMREWCALQMAKTLRKQIRLSTGMVTNPDTNEVTSASPTPTPAGSTRPASTAQQPTAGEMLTKVKDNTVSTSASDKSPCGTKQPEPTATTDITSAANRARAKQDLAPIQPGQRIITSSDRVTPSSTAPGTTFIPTIGIRG